MSVKTPFILSILLILAGGILVNCSSNSPNDGDGDSSSSRGLSSSGEEEQKWCVYRQDEMCLRGSSPCPGDGGILEDECPAGYDGGGQKLDSSDSGEGSSSSDDSGSGDSSDSGEGSSSDNGGSDDSSSSGTSSSSSVALYEYCIFEAQQLCSKGDELVSRCPPGGKLGNTCPYSSSSSTHTEEPSSSSRIIEYSEFTDSRDGQTYKTVIIGSQTWMAQNLNYFPPGTSVKPDGVTNTGVSACYNDSNSYKPPYSNPGACFSSNASLNGNDVHCIATETVKNCEKYGRLYDWSTAMGLEQACNRKKCIDQIQPKHQGVCPSGWHVPTDDEWTELKNYAGGEFEGGPNLKATHSWDDYQKTIDWETFEKETVSGNGFDAFGFAALAGGYFYAADGIDALNMFAAKGQYHGLGKQGYWWTATEYTNPNNGESIKATSRLIKNEAYHVQSSWENKGDNWFYVRCVKD